MTHDFNYVWNMVTALRTTSSTKDKEDLIKINCEFLVILQHNLLKRFFSILIIHCGNIILLATI
jgi:short-subunit dehydrogenase